MHAYIFIGKDKTRIRDSIRDLADQQGIKIIDLPMQKIEDARSLKTITKLSHNQKTGICIEDIEKATTETLNSFLKELEEPGENITYFLTSSSQHLVLPTILSRCRLVKVSSERMADKDSLSLAQEYISAQPAQRFSKTIDIKDRKQALEFVENLMTGTRALMLEEPRFSYAQVLRVLSAVHTALNGNANVVLQLTYLAISI